MNYPLISEYVEAIKSPEDNFNQLKNLRPVLDEAGNPIMTSGNFAVVFKMEEPETGKRYAVKCFIKDQEGRSEAYRQISEELKDVESDYLTSFQYLEKELFVDTSQSSETEYPVLVMDWVEGITLDEFIRNNLDDQYILGILAYRFSRLAEWLLSQPFAHGDLKPDNIIIQPGCWLTLVDYDGMYVPAMKGQRAREIGSPDFQHPARTEDTFDEHIDDFPIITILLSVKALSIDPGLLESFGATDRLLLSSKDYHDIGKSRFFNKTYPNSDVDFNRLVALLHFSLAQQSLQGIIPEVLKLKEPEYDMDYPKQWIDELGVSYSADGLRLLFGSNIIINYCCRKGIIYIGDYAFAGCSNLSSLIIPDSVTSIGDTAFDGCSGLSSIIIPNSVTSIGDRAFWGCSGLSSIIIPNSITCIGDCAFWGCSGLSSIIIPNSITCIGDCAFWGCSGLSSIIIPNSVTSIGDCVFEGCSGLSSIIIPDSVTSIGDRAFYECSCLSSVIIPETVTSISDEAFSGCSSLSSIIIPDSVTSIGDKAFEGCSVLSSIIIPNSVTSIGVRAFDGCLQLSSIFIPASVINIHPSAFKGCALLDEINIDSKNHFYDSRNNCNAIIETKTNALIIGCNRTIIPNSVNRIHPWAFEGLSNLSNISIPESVTELEYMAFRGCGISRIHIPKSVVNIKHYVFSDCPKLDSIIVDKENPKYDSREDCNAIIETGSNQLICGCRNSIIPDSVVSIEEGAFSGCSLLFSITIPDSVKQIGDRAFEKCTNLKTISIPHLITSIGKRAFLSCTSLSSIEIPESVTIISDFAFCNCEKLNSVVIPHSVTSIGFSSFAGCSNLKNINLPDSLTHISECAFTGCSNLLSIVIPASVSYIGQNAFAGCSRLSSIVIPKGVKVIGSDTFSGCEQLESIIFEQKTDKDANQEDIRAEFIRRYHRINVGRKTIEIPLMISIIDEEL